MSALRIQPLKAGIALWLIISGHSARAARSSTPEYFYQPNVNAIAISVEGHQMLSGSASRYQGGTKIDDVKYGSTGYSFTFAYGFSESWAIHLKLSTENRTWDYTSVAGTPTAHRASGMNDTFALLTNITALGQWSLNVGVGAGVSPGAHLDEQANVDGNNLSGGVSVLNYVGLSTPTSGGNYLGLKGQYFARMQRSGNNNLTPATEYVMTGGHEASLGAFYEWNFSPASLDASILYQVVDPTLRTYPTGTNTRDGSKNLLYALGAQYQISASANFRVEYLVAMYPEVIDAGTSTGAHSESWGTARLRFEF